MCVDLMKISIGYKDKNKKSKGERREKTGVDGEKKSLFKCFLI